MAVTPPPGQVTRFVTAAKDSMSVDAFIVLTCAKLTAGCSGESDDGEELGEGHCDWRRTGRGKEPRRPGSFVLFI